MYKDLDRQLRVIKMTGKKPNFAELAREFGCDYRTVKRHYEGDGKTKYTRNKPSKLDPYKELIRSKLAIKGCTVKGIYEFLLDEELYFGSYSNLRKYVKDHELKAKTKSKGHPRFETLPGCQAQADWKENITIHNCYGEEIVFNVFHIVLGFSRLSYLEISLGKTEADVQRVLMNAFKYFGGVPKEILFDNMSTASVRVPDSRRRKVNPQLAMFARDFGFEPKLCKVRAAYTKGKVESRNKIIDWIRPYDGEIQSLEGLESKINHINAKMNNYICQATNKPPTLLFQKEKEYLHPLPSLSIFENYLTQNKVTVGKDSTIYYQGCRYSVNPALIGHLVNYEVIHPKLYIYYNLKLHTVHDISEGKKKINYKEAHYRQLLKNNVKDEDLESIIKQNLKNFDELLGG